ncbi:MULTISPECIES: LysR family transcriptional regulator [Cupriavidus]|nr:MULTISPECIES: LysR family transcriptional regulator [Cupriavidus]
MDTRLRHAAADMNWDNTRYFLAIARSGSLRGAAASLEVDQATVGRRLAAFEEELGATLFLRTPQGYVLSQAGEMMLADAEQMESAAEAIGRKSALADRLLAGPVRIATTDTLAEGFVLPALAALQRRHPELEYTLLTATELVDVAAREADLAVRGLRPQAGNVIIKKLGVVEMGLYAAPDYLARRGKPRRGAGLSGHDLLMFPRDTVPRHWQELGGESLRGAHVALQSNSQMALRSAALRGMGIALLSAFLAERDSGLVRIFPDRRDWVDIWLVLHPDLRRVARVRAVIEALAGAFKR